MMSSPVNSQARVAECILLKMHWIDFLSEVCNIARARYPNFVAPIDVAISRAIPEGVEGQGRPESATIQLSKRQRGELFGIIVPYVKQVAPALFEKSEGEQIRIRNMCDSLTDILRIRE